MFSHKTFRSGNELAMRPFLNEVNFIKFQVDGEIFLSKVSFCMGQFMLNQLPTQVTQFVKTCKQCVCHEYLPSSKFK